MRLKKIISCAAVAIASIAACIVSMTEETAVDNLNLSDVEAIAACEVSSNASNNQGYCSALYGGEGDACIQNGDGASVRCSGNF